MEIRRRLALGVAVVRADFSSGFPYAQERSVPAKAITHPQLSPEQLAALAATLAAALAPPPEPESKYEPEPRPRFEPEKYLSPHGAAAYLDVGISTVYRRMQEGMIPYTRLGKRAIRIKRSDLDALADRQESA